MTQWENPRLTPPVGQRDHIRGPGGAPVTLVEYGDYQYPYCGTAHPVIDELRRRLGDRLRVVFRNFPCPEAHPHAQQAAEAAEAAAAQGKFWEMHDLLFEHPLALDDAGLAGHAAGLGLDVDRFKCELAEHVYAPRVGEDVLGGVRSGVSRTPAFFINGVRHDGFFSLPALLQAIEDATAEGATSASRPTNFGDVPAPDVADDKVGQASLETFPASDAPGWSRGEES